MLTILCLLAEDNHWPETISARSSIIAAVDNGRGSRYNLKVEGEDMSVYEYEGVQRPSKMATLLYSSVDRSFSLDPLDTEFLFNLRSTPSQRDPVRLAHQYPQLEAGDDDVGQDGKDLFDDAVDGDQSPEEEEAPDPSNPYDYRHFLNKGGRSPSPAPSATSSPVPVHSFSNSSPALKSPTTSNHPPKLPRSKPKEQRREKPRYLSPLPTSEVVEEEAEVSNQDADPLEIDLGDVVPIQSKPWRSALGILNEGGRNSGPISLRSAASSMSPSVRAVESDGDKDDGDRGDKDEDEDDNDDDIEEIDLNNNHPEATTPQGDAATPGNGWDDNEIDLEAELELALGDQANEEADHENGGVSLENGHEAGHTRYGGPITHVVDESSSESEEE